MTTQLQQISDIAWLVYDDAGETGILNKGVQDRFTYISGTDVIQLKNDKAVQRHFGNTKIFEEQITAPTETDKEFYIQGHKVHYHDPYPLDTDHPDYRNDLPLYTKTPTSKVYYAAGWFCVNMEKSWKHGNGTKLSTLLHYGYEGPFKTYEECKERLKVLNAEKMKNEKDRPADEAVDES